MTVETQSRRQELQQVAIRSTTYAHAGLWLDKYLEYQVEGGGDNAKKPHFEKVAECRVSSAYVTFFKQWRDNLERTGAVIQVAQAQGRLAIGLGSESVLETAITLHHTYGVPYIPGSALKGLAARYARTRLDEETWGKDKEAYKVLFGDTTGAGYVTFFDALYIPGVIKDDRPLALDVITVHHPEYYRGENSPPTDWDNPNPVPFLSTTGSYLIALHGTESWVNAAYEILELALAEEGIGAKTSSGYGRMIFEGKTHKPSSTKAQEPYALARRRLLDEQPPKGRFRGTLATVKGSYGFINPARGGKQRFVHESQIRSGKPLREGQVVEYQMGLYKGKPQAQDVEILLEPQ
jgi:CRISPR-associated protein Cmr6